MEDHLKKLRGLVATVSITGDVISDYSINFSNLRDYNSRKGFTEVEYRVFDAKLVEAGRDDVCKHALQQAYDWILMIDADAAPFPEDSLERLLRVAFIDLPFSHMVGAYCQLKQYPHLPTIDTGTGTWEVVFPHSGVLEVIRTGGHFFLLKTDALRLMGQPPWFRTRLSISALQAMAEVDNFARVVMHGKNPLADSREWLALLQQARVSPHAVATHVGEDSSFCDRLRSVGGRIFVDTSLIVGHVTKRVITPDDFVEAIRKHTSDFLASIGVLNYET